MRPSATQALVSLQLPEREKAPLKAATREWLKARYNDDDNLISRLSKYHIKAQASRFLWRNGHNFFSKEKEGRLVWGKDNRQDKELVGIIAEIMNAQADYRGRKVKEREREHRPRGESEFDIYRDSPESACDSPEDHDYKPRHAPLSNSGPKTYGTRQNALPGMPIRSSIEERPDFTVRRGYFSDGSDSGAETDLDGGSETDGVETPSTAESRRISAARVAPNVTSWTASQTFVDVPQRHRSIPLDQPQQFSLAYGRPQYSLLQAGGSTETTNRTLQESFRTTLDLTQSAPHIQRPSTVPGFPNFDDFIDSDGDQDDNIELSNPIQPKSLPLSPNTRMESPRCEQTPPSSGRSVAGRRPAQRRTFMNTNSKPRLRNVTEDVMDLASSDEFKLFISSDHYEVVRRDQAAQILQSVINTLNDVSRDCQQTLYRMSDSSSQRKSAEQTALFMCKLMGTLRDDKHIWTGTQAS